MTTRNNITIPATAPINQYGAVLARWLGVSSADLGMVFPDLGNFGGDWAGALNFLDVPDRLRWVVSPAVTTFASHHPDP